MRVRGRQHLGGSGDLRMTRSDLRLLQFLDAFSGANWAKCTINNNNHSIASHLTGVKC